MRRLATALLPLLLLWPAQRALAAYGVGIISAQCPNGTTSTTGCLSVGGGLSVSAGAVSLNLGATQTWTGPQTFTDGDFLLKGSASGAMTLKAPSAASTFVITFPAATDTVEVLGATQTVTGARTFSGGLTFTSLPTTGSISTTLCLTSAGLVRTSTSNCFSSLRALKRDIAALIGRSALDEAMALRPVAYNRRRGDVRRQAGFIAEEVERVDPRCASYDGTGRLEAYHPECIVAILTAALQEQQAEIDRLRRVVEHSR